MTKGTRLSKQALNTIFIEGLGDHIVWHSDISSFPLLVDLQPRNLHLRVYLWNCTNPPGGRTLDEYKIQVILPGQQRGERGQLDADKHSDFAYSGNMQVKVDAIVESLCTRISESVRNNNERIVCARPQYLYDAIIRRMDIMHEDLLGVDHGP